jgi:hypothetical protein
MNRIGKLWMAAGILALASSSAFAGGNIVTRSVEDAHADLMRTYKSHGGQPAGTLTSRNADNAHSDLMRDWSARSSGEAGRAVQARTEDASYIDLMRMWAGVVPPVSN